MYQPQDMAAPAYPVPQKINGRIVSFIGGKGAAFVAAVGVVAAILYATVGGMTTVVEEPLTEYEKGTALTDLRIERAAVQCSEAKAELARYEDSQGIARADLSQAEKERFKELSKAYSEAGLVMGAKGAAARDELVAKAAADGITSSTTDEDLEAMVPGAKEVEVQSIDQVQRLIFFLILPIGIALAIVAEPMGMQSLASMANDRIQFNKRRRAFLYSRLEYDQEDNDRWQ